VGKLEGHDGRLGVRAELPIDYARIKARCTQCPLNVLNLTARHEGSRQTIDHSVGWVDRDWVTCGVDDAWNQDAHVPSSLGEGGTNNAIFGRMRLDRPSEPIGDNDVTGRPWLRYAQDVGAWSPCCLIDGDDLTKALRVPIPESCEGIGRCGIAKIPVTSIKARCRLKNNPRCKL